MKQNVTQKKHESHSCSDHIHISSRQASVATAFALGCGFVFFISGYFWGNKKATEHFHECLQRESLADHIYFSLCSLQDAQNDSGSSSYQEAKPTQQALDDTIEEGDIDTHAQSYYQANIAGFTSRQAAQKFVHKLHEYGFVVHMKQRTSATAEGTQVAWYQVVSLPMKEKSSVERMISELKKREKLQDCTIVSLKSTENGKDLA